MTMLWSADIDHSVEDNRLISKDNFDRVSAVNKKPSAVTEGSDEKTSDSGETKSDRETGSPILSKSPNLYKQNGDCMSENGFIQIPRSLLVNPQWNRLRLKYKHVFLTLLFNACWENRPYCIDTHEVIIERGQFCTSIRELVEICNRNTPFKDDKVDKNIVERSVSVLTKIGFVRQEVRHGKSIFTITYPGIYDCEKRQSETQSETKPRLNRDTNEERKEDSSFVKGTNIVRARENFVDSSNSSLLEKNKEKRIYTSEEVDLLSWFCESNQISIKDQTVRNWLAYYDLEYIKSQIEILLKGKEKGLKIKTSDERWLQSALNRDYHTSNENKKINYDFCVSIKKEKNWNELEVLKSYCRIERISFDLYYHLPPEDFRNALMSKYEL